MNGQETQFAFAPGFSKLALPSPGCQRSPAGVRRVVAEPRDPSPRGTRLPPPLLPAVRTHSGEVCGGTHPSGVGPWPTIPLYFDLISPTDLYTPSVVRLNILAWREGRRELRGPSKPVRLFLGRGGLELGVAPRGAPGGSAARRPDSRGSERLPRESREPEDLPALLGTPGFSSWAAFCSAPCVTFSLWRLL